MVHKLHDFVFFIYGELQLNLVIFKGKENFQGTYVKMSAPEFSTAPLSARSNVLIFKALFLVSMFVIYKRNEHTSDLIF